jgi:DNA polymerase-4/DNA polymerase V
VWGIGPNTTAFLQKHGIRTALEYAQRPEAWVKKFLSKPFYQIWQELNGAYVFELATGEHETYYTIQKVKTFTPASSDRAFVLAQLAKNIENACIKARKYNPTTLFNRVFRATAFFDARYRHGDGAAACQPLAARPHPPERL